MASVKIYENRPVFTKRIEQDFLINTSITSPAKRVAITSTPPFRTRLIEQDFLINTSITAPTKKVAINSTLPFRIRLTAIRIEAAGATSVPPIPLQIIGFSNYIL